MSSLVAVGMRQDLGSPGLAHYDRLFGRRTRRELDRDSLPSPIQYLSQRGLLKRGARGNWASITCPVHKNGNEANPSLRVNLIDGHFKCMACGASGGDIVALHRLASGLGFVDAVHAVGGRFYD
jgi:hypothetical protein